ncbi:hypothetical protein MMPV_005489 [Pyropia vietnamensis]
MAPGAGVGTVVRTLALPSSRAPLPPVSLLDLPDDVLLDILSLPSLAELPSSGLPPTVSAAARTCTRLRALAAVATTHLAIPGARRRTMNARRRGDARHSPPRSLVAADAYVTERVASLAAHLDRLPRLCVVSLGAAAAGPPHVEAVEEAVAEAFFVEALRHLAARSLNALILTGAAVDAAVSVAPSLQHLPLRSLCLRGLDHTKSSSVFVTLLDTFGGSLQSLAVLDMDADEEPSLNLMCALCCIRTLPRLTAICLTGPLSVDSTAHLATKAPALTSLTLSDWRWTAEAVTAALPPDTAFPALTSFTRRITSPLDHNGGDVSGWPRVRGGASGGVNAFVAARPALTRVSMVHVWGRREPDFGVAAGGGEQLPR